jgi:hypothetical protein
MLETKPESETKSQRLGLKITKAARNGINYSRTYSPAFLPSLSLSLDVK